MDNQDMLALLPGYRATVTEYWVTGSRDEPEGVTLMTRSVYADDGSPHIQMAGGPDNWYLPRKVDKAEFDAIAEELTTGARGHFGVVSAAQAEANRIEAETIVVARWVEANRIKIKRAKKDSADLGETLEACLVEVSTEFKNSAPHIRSAILALADTI